MDTIRMVGLGSAQPANGRIRPLAPHFHAALCGLSPWAIYSPEISGLFSAVMSYCRLHSYDAKPVRDRKTDAPAGRISCAFLCILLPQQRQMRGYVLQLLSQLSLGHVKGSRSRECAQCGTLRLLSFSPRVWWPTDRGSIAPAPSVPSRTCPRPSKPESVNKTFLFRSDSARVVD
jgi:hypothetical protein